MDETWNLRRILSQNIRTARETLHITQAKLAEYADISLPYMADIEYCKTWVSDKTLVNIARALNMEAYELLTPPNRAPARSREQAILLQIAELINGRKRTLREFSVDSLDDLMRQIVRLYSE